MAAAFCHGNFDQLVSVPADQHVRSSVGCGLISQPTQALLELQGAARLGDLHRGPYLIHADTSRFRHAQPRPVSKPFTHDRRNVGMISATPVTVTSGRAKRIKTACRRALRTIYPECQSIPRQPQEKLCPVKPMPLRIY